MTKLIDIVTGAAIATGTSIESIITTRTGGPHVAMVREQVMWISASIYGVEIWEIASLMQRPKRAVKAGVDHIDALYGKSDRVRRQICEIILAIDRLEVDEIRATIRKYRSRGATIPSIARFVGVPKEVVALVLGVAWGKSNDGLSERGA